MTEAEAVEQNKAITDILRVIASSPADLQPVFDTILSHAKRLCQGNAAVIWQCDGSSLHYAASHGGTDPAAAYFGENPLPLGAYNPTPQAALERRTVHVADVFADRKYRPLIPKDSFGTLPNAGTVLAVPLLRQDELFGVISIWRFEKRLFTDKQIAMIEAFAAQAAIAIHNVRLHNETKEALEQQTATSEILGVISSSPTDLAPVFDAILKRATQLCDAHLGVLNLYDGENLRSVAQQGANPEFAKYVFERGAFKPVGGFGRMLAERRAVQVPDLREGDAYRARKTNAVKMVEVAGARTFLAVPLLKEGRVIGGISIYRPEVRPFTEKQIALVSVFANQAVIAIENVRLFNETKDALEQQTATADILKVISASPTDTQPVFQAIAERAARICEASDTRIFVAEGDKLRYVAGFGDIPEVAALRPIERGFVLGRALIERVALQVDDVLAVPEEFPTAQATSRPFGIRTILAMPLIREGSALGGIVLRRTEVRPFNEKQIALLRTFADQAAIAIENVRLFNETKEALEQQTATAEILKVISSTPTDTQPVFDAIVKSALRMFEGTGVGISLKEGNGVRIVAEGGNLFTPDPGHLRPLDRNVSVGARALVDNAVVNIADTEGADTPSFTQERARRLGFRAIAAAPMRREGIAIGSIAVMRKNPGALSEKHMELLQTFAAQAVIAIENVRLFNETKDSLERQTATADILRVITSSPTDLKPVMAAVVENAARLADANHALIGQAEGGRLRWLAAYGCPLPGDTRSITRNVPSGRAMLDLQSTQVEDVALLTGDVGVERAYRELGVRTIFATPLVREGRAVGVLLLRRTEVRPFTEKQVSLLKTFADQAAIAIENVRLFNETKEALDQQTATAEILKVISSSPTDMQPVFDAIVQSATRLFESYTAVITMREGHFLQRKARAGPNLLMSSAEQAELEKIYPLPLDPKISISARAIVECRTIEVLDTEAEHSDVAKQIGRLGKHRSVTAVPLIRESGAIGTIVLTRPEPGCKLSEKQLALVKTFADQAVIAIENVRLFNELQTTNASLRETLEQQTATGDILKVISRSTTDIQPVFETIIRNAVRLCDAVSGGVFRFDGVNMDIGALDKGLPPEVEAMFRAGFPVRASNQTPSAQAILEKRVINVADIFETDYPEAVKQRARAFGYRSLLTVPMMREDAPVGAIEVVRREPGAFSDSYVSLLKTFADQAVIAIENVRLFNETKEALEQQTAISEVLRVISNSPADVQPVLEAVAERAAKICDAVDAQIFLREGDGMKHVARFGPFPIGIELGHARRVSRGWVAGRAVLEGKAIHIEDLMAVPRDEYPVSHELRDRAGHRTLLSVPLMRERRALGAISLRRMEVRPFTEKQIALLQTFADQGAIAIENVRLFNETKEALEQQKASADVLAVISSSIADTKPVFDKILESCQRLFAGRNVGINVVGDDGRIYIGAYKGYGRAELEAHFPVPLSTESGSGAAIVQRQVVHYPDSEAADVPEYARRGGRIAGNKSVLFAPMLWEGKGIGAIFVGRPVAGPFSQKEIALLKTFADQAAIAIQNARLFKEIQEKSAQLEVANKHKSDFLANMSHELRTPLNAIIGFSEALMERMFGEVNDKQADYLKDIHESGEHLLSLINDILDLSKIEAGRMDLELSSFHLPTALSNAMTLIRERAQRHGIELGLEVDQRLGEFQADERKFKQIMLNLLSNAVKFTPDGGRVDVCATKDTDKIEIAVKDTGIGIAPEDQAVVFEEFKQVGRDQMRKAEGTGLGLALTRRFVELHGGAIRLESTPGKGSTFTVSLPLRAG